MKTGIAGRLAESSITSKLTPLLLAAALAIGLYSVFTMPSREEPEIVVPVADMYMPTPGYEPHEIENRVLIPAENVVAGIEGVKYVYSHASPGMAFMTVRFEVGADMERSLVRLYSTLMKNMDRMPEGLRTPMVKTVTIDDVPFFTLTLSSDSLDHRELRAVGEEVATSFKATENVRDVSVIGGFSRAIQVELSPDRMAAYGVDPALVARRLEAANTNLESGRFARGNRVIRVEAGPFLSSAADVRGVVLDVRDGQAIRLGDVATVTDGSEEVDSYTFSGPAGGDLSPMVTLAVSKRGGSDATELGRQLEDRVEDLEAQVIPEGVRADVTRNYGETAREKVSTLRLHLLMAILAVGLVVALFMGWRSAVVVMMAVPITFALTLFVYRIFGYTLNRVTLFALIFVTGIVIDDSIIVVENMYRHFKMKDRPLMAAARAAVDEVGNPTILATLTVIAAVLPMLFVSGLMGPYMSPMPIGSTLAMTFSLIIALVGAPWLAFRLLPGEVEEEEGGEGGAAGGAPSGGEGAGGPGGEEGYVLEDTRMYRFYRRVMDPLLEKPARIKWMLGGVVLLLLGSVGLFAIRAVTVKMLPFDDKNEMQVLVDTPEGTSLETTTNLATRVHAALGRVPEVEDVQLYGGTAAPFNFNGLIRHYYLRQGPNVADLQVNLVPKGERSAQSHDVARRVRPVVKEALAGADSGVVSKIVEVPPGPPVRATLVAEVYGDDPGEQRQVARRVRELFEQQPGVVDVDWSLTAPQREVRFRVDEEKAALSGVSKPAVVQSLRIGLHGSTPTHLSAPDARSPVPIRVQLSEAERSGADRLAGLRVASRGGGLVPVGELVHAVEDTVPQVIDRKNMRRVVYVTAAVAGEEESPVYAILDLREKLAQIEVPGGGDLRQLYTDQPESTDVPAVKWDGEWQITYEVFRDLGIAFAGALLLIYALIVGWFGSLTTPLVMMAAIPLTLIGIAPGHWAFGAFFTATSMIGMIALAGIMVRNGILLIDYLEVRLDAGVPLKKAVIEAGAVRTRPIALTAGTVIIGAAVILFDPIFEGLAVSLITGAVASTALTLIVVPSIYFLAHREDDGGPDGGEPSGEPAGTPSRGRATATGEAT
ncbi:MAG: efflux RND transporter permease subunit [Candidatus Palauibacterales bacterium]|nr:efflux RND transporter permease subunit [Candidatus Palauibacterales bacterium]